VRTNQCEKAVKKIESDVLPTNSVINSYAKLKYIEVIENCNQIMPGLKKTLAPNVISVLEEVKEIRPYYTRIWIFLGKYTNILIENKEAFKIKNVDELKKQANAYFEKAYQLSPEHEEILLGQIQTDFILEEYQIANEKIKKCLILNPESSYCWWLKVLSDLYLNEVEQAAKDIKIATEKQFNFHSEKNISQFSAACEKIENPKCFAELTDIYYTVMVNNHSDPKYHFRLIYISARGEKEEMLKEEIKSVLKNWPELESELNDTFELAYQHPNKINNKAISQYINNYKRWLEIETALNNLSGSELQLTRRVLDPEFTYLNETNKQIKLINK